MTEKGLPVNAWSVRHILAGTKTETRRIKRNDKPRYKVGDVLWLRETLSCGSAFAGRPKTLYEATRTAIPYADGCPEGWCGTVPWQWKKDKLPSVFMPKWAARPQHYTVTAVYEQRLGDMTEDDAKQEGAVDMLEFRHVWLCIHDKWDPDLVVWVYQFEEKKP